MMTLPSGLMSRKLRFLVIVNKKRVDFDSGGTGRKSRPAKQGQTEFDGSRIQRIDGVVEIHGEVVVGVHRPRDVNEYLREVGVDAPVVCFIGVSQGKTRHPSAKSHVIELAANRPETDFDVTKTLAERQLRKGQTKELIKAGKSSEFVIAVITGDAFVELVAREMVD